MKKIRVFYRGMVLLFFFILLFIWIRAKKTNISGRSDCLKEIKMEVWIGRVYSKERTRNNHNFGEVYIKRTNENLLRKINCGCYDENFYDIVCIGDSIYKDMNSLNCFVISDSISYLFKPVLFN